MGPQVIADAAKYLARMKCWVEETIGRNFVSVKTLNSVLIRVSHGLEVHPSIQCSITL